MAITIDELKRNVFPGESGGDYNALYGYANRPGGQFSGVNLTDMTLGDVLQFTDPRGPYAQWVKGQVGRVATPTGAFQAVGTTLRGAVDAMGLPLTQKYDPTTQDAIGMWIYQNQGPGAWEAWGGGGGNVRKSSKGTGMGLLDMPAEQPRTLMDRIRSPETVDNLLSWVNSMRLNPDPNIGGMIENRQARRAEADVANRTAAWLRTQGAKGQELAGAVESGMLGGREAASLLYEPAGGGQRGVVVGGNVVDPITGEIIYQGQEAPVDTAPATFRAMDMQARAAGLVPKSEGGDGSYENFMLTRGAGYSAEAGAVGTARGEAIAGAPGKIAIANMIDAQVNELLNDPYLPQMLGPMASRLPNVSGDAARVQSKMDQILGGAFLQARDLLKGAGAITDFESQKAESAFIRMNAAQNEEDFRSAMRDFQSAVRSGMSKLDQISGGGAAPVGGGTMGLSDDDLKYLE